MRAGPARGPNGVPTAGEQIPRPPNERPVGTGCRYSKSNVRRAAAEIVGYTLALVAATLAFGPAAGVGAGYLLAVGAAWFYFAPTQIGGCGRCSGRATNPCPMSRIRVFSVEMLQYLPSIL